MTRDQAGIALTGAPALALAAFVVVVTLNGAVALPDAWIAERLRLAIGCIVVIGLTLLWGILDVALARLFSPADIAGAGLTEATAPIKLRRAVLQNTLEQTVLAAIAYVALAAFAPDAALAVIPALAGLFVLGRVLFRFGYRYGAPGRAPGNALCVAPTIAAYALILSYWAAPHA